MKKAFTTVLTPAPLPHENPEEIIKALHGLAGGLSGKIVLNYTSGTKAMCVHSYMLIAHMYPDAEFHYLRNKRLHIHGLVPTDVTPISTETQNIQLASLLQLHDCSLEACTAERPHSLSVSIAKEIVELNLTAAGQAKWLAWRESLPMRTKTQADFFTKLDWNRAPGNLAGLIGGSYSSIADKANELAAVGFRPQTITIRNTKTQEASALYEFLKGGWLEVWCSDRARELQRQQVIKNMGKVHSNVMVNLPQPEVAGKRQQAEVDIAFTLGTQLHVISCSADTLYGDKGMTRAKPKVFEVIERSKQLGGDFARSALVCLAEDAAAIQASFNKVKHQEAFKVFGINELKNLDQAILTWLEGHQNL
jgi:hypothetical protein